MKFVDEAVIKVMAGNGGAGCASFRREKYIPFGGPDGGDGGNGGSVYLIAKTGLNTLVDFRHQRTHKAQTGESGKGRKMYGKKGEDKIIEVPIGTRVFDIETEEQIGELLQQDDLLLVAKGGDHGIGNVHFKTSTNRAPRQCTPGYPGEQRELKLELIVLADVGLLGMPNAGKSSLIRKISSAKPKVADYPFTTLYPNLGVVSAGSGNSFVIADIPGVIEGAAEGAGLGLQFLKHLERTQLLLHLVDIAPADEQVDPADEVLKITHEITKYAETLANKPRWLVINKTDLLSGSELAQRQQALLEKTQWQGKVYAISAHTGAGTTQLVQDLALHCCIENEPDIVEDKEATPWHPLD